MSTICSTISKRPFRRAFSLFELLAVILLMAIFAAAVRGPVVEMLDRITVRNAIEQLRTMDRLTRQEARQSGKIVTMHIDPLEGLLWRTDTTTDQNLIGQRARLPEQVRIDQIRIAPDRSDFDELNAEFKTSPQGITNTYALTLQTPMGNRWLIFAGLTGTCYELESEDQLANVFDEMSRSWSELD